MSRLKSLLRVADPSTCNTQQILAGTVPDESGHRSQSLLPDATTSTRNAQREWLRCCVPVAQHMHTMQHAEQLREFESLLAIVGPAYNTPANEYADIREAARRDPSGAIATYRELAKQHETESKEFSKIK